MQTSWGSSACDLFREGRRSPRRTERANRRRERRTAGEVPALQTAARPHHRQSPVECCQQGTPSAHLIPGRSSQPPCGLPDKTRWLRCWALATGAHTTTRPGRGPHLGLDGSASTWRTRSPAQGIVTVAPAGNSDTQSSAVSGSEREGQGGGQARGQHQCPASDGRPSEQPRGPPPRVWAAGSGILMPGLRLMNNSRAFLTVPA